MHIVSGLLDQVAHLDGLHVSYLVDAGTGMIVAERAGEGRAGVPEAAAAAVNVVDVLTDLTATLARGDEVEDAIVTLSTQLHLIRLLRPSAAPPLILVVVLNRDGANLGMAHREIRALAGRLR